MHWICALAKKPSRWSNIKDKPEQPIDTPHWIGKMHKLLVDIIMAALARSGNVKVGSSGPGWSESDIVALVNTGFMYNGQGTDHPIQADLQTSAFLNGTHPTSNQLRGPMQVYQERFSTVSTGGLPSADFLRALSGVTAFSVPGAASTAVLAPVPASVPAALPVPIAEDVNVVQAPVPAVLSAVEHGAVPAAIAWGYGAWPCGHCCICS